LRNFLAQLSVFDDRASTHRHLKKESDLAGTCPASRVDGLLNGVPAQQFVVLGYFVQSLSESRRRELASVWIKLGVGWHRSVGPLKSKISFFKNMWSGSDPGPPCITRFLTKKQ